MATEQEALKFVKQKIQKIEDLLDVMSKDKTKQAIAITEIHTRL
ncbi:hypothetical protein [Marinomonas mediterranea]|nr:hypothetical protein [Marinomonas mediterranea]